MAFFLADAWKIAVMAALALAIFATWFWLDPDPQAVWREFVVGENVGKLDPQGSSYLSKLLWGGSSIWSLALAFLANAGLLAFQIVGLLVVTYQRRAQLSDAERLLWILIVALFVVFSLPSQRSGRYLLPAMPALAVLCALSWDQIIRKSKTRGSRKQGGQAWLIA